MQCVCVMVVVVVLVGGIGKPLKQLKKMTVYFAKIGHALKNENTLLHDDAYGYAHDDCLIL